MTAKALYKMSFKVYTILEIKKGFSRQIIPQKYYHVAVWAYVATSTILLKIFDQFGVNTKSGYCITKNSIFVWQFEIGAIINIILSIYTIYVI